MEKAVDRNKRGRIFQEFATSTNSPSWNRLSARKDMQSTGQKRTNEPLKEGRNERTKEWQEEQTDEIMNDIIICINTAGTASQLIQGLPTWRKALGPNLADNHYWFDWFTVFCFFYFLIFSLSSYLAVTQVAPRALCDMGNNCSDVLLLILIV